MGRELGFKVRVKLLEKNMTQVELANIIGISKQNLNNVINGARNLKLEELLEHFVKTGEVRKEIYYGTDQH